MIICLNVYFIVNQVIKTWFFFYQFFFVYQNIRTELHIYLTKSHFIYFSSLLSSCCIYWSDIISSQVGQLWKGNYWYLLCSCQTDTVDTIGHSLLFQLNFHLLPWWASRSMRKQLMNTSISTVQDKNMVMFCNYMYTIFV